MIGLGVALGRVAGRLGINVPPGAVLDLNAAAIVARSNGVQLVPNVLNGHAAARFDGVDDRATVANFASLFSGAGTLCIVHTVRDADYTLASTSNNGHYDRFGGNGEAYPGVFHATDRYYNYGQPPFVGTHIKTYAAGGTWQMILNAVPGELKLNHAFGFQNTTLHMGRAPDGAGDVGGPFSGDIIRVLAWPRLLTGVELRQLDTALIRQYGLRNVVFEGDSRTQGSGATAGNDYPAQCMRLLDARWHHLSSGVGGETISIMRATAPTAIDPRFDARWNHNILVLCGGTNDLLSSSAEAAYAEAMGYLNDRAAVGWRPIVTTIPYRSNGDVAKWDAFNALVRSNGVYPVADVAAAPQLQNPANTTYFTDGVHHTDAGYAVYASVVRPVIEAR